MKLTRLGSIGQMVTPLGRVALLCVAFGLTLGIGFSWIEAWFIAVCAASVLLIGVPFLLGSRAYRIALEVSRASVVVGGRVLLTIRVQNAALRPQLPALVEVPVGDALREITVPALGPRQHTAVQVTVPTMRRGVIRVGPVTVARQDPLGLLRREMTWRDTPDVHVHPRTVPLPPNMAGLVRDLDGQASSRITDSDLSFHAVREYAPGDAIRHIHWKSTAKTGTLMVRQYEESQTARVAVLFDALRHEYASDEEFELGVSIAASCSLQAVREKREHFIASAFRPGRQRATIDGLEELPSAEPTRLLDAWSELEQTSRGVPIETLASHLAHSTRHLSLVLLVTGSIPDLARLRRAAASFTAEVSVLAVRAELLADPKVQRIDTLTLATVGALDDLPQLIRRWSP